MMADVMHDVADAGCISGSSKQSTNGEDIQAQELIIQESF
jgi:hypothetical protein